MSIKTKAQLAAEANANINTNGTNAITGAVHNTMLNNTFDSVVSIIDAETINGVKTFGSFPVTPSAAPTTDYQVANKKYVDDNTNGIRISDVSLTNLTVASLGTKQTLLSAPGVGFYYKIYGVTCRVVVTTQLQVGAQNLWVAWDDGITFQPWGNLANGAVETATTARFHVFEFDTGSPYYVTIPNNTALVAVLSGSTNPTGGSAQMDFNITYSVETY